MSQRFPGVHENGSFLQADFEQIPESFPACLVISIKEFGMQLLSEMLLHSTLAPLCMQAMLLTNRSTTTTMLVKIGVKPGCTLLPHFVQTFQRQCWHRW